MLNLKLKIRWVVNNLKFRLKYYKIFHKKRGEENVTIFFLQKMNLYPGIADIIKAIVGSYYISKINGTSFKIVFKYPFILSDYLAPNQINWEIQNNEIDYSMLHTSLINYKGVGHKIIYPKSSNQYHIYNFMGLNILQRNNVQDWEKKWHELFWELFKPTSLIKDSLDNIPFKEGDFIAVHIRFVNALEITEPSCLSWSHPLDTCKKDALLKKIFTMIDKLWGNSTSNILLFSDSNEFLDIAKTRGIECLPGKVGHIGYKDKQDTVLKTFIDWFAMAKASKIYRIKGDCLYNSAFPLYASLIGNKPYIELNLNDYE